MTNYLSPREDASKLENLLRGGALGFSGLAALYGANEVRKYLTRKLLPENKVFKDDLLLFEKQSSAIKDHFMYGAGIPLGAYLGYKTLGFLENRSDVLKIKAKLREYSDLVKTPPPEHLLGSPEELEELNLYKQSMDMYEDTEINDFLEGYLDKSASWISNFLNEAGEFGYEMSGVGADAVRAAPTIITRILPVMSGALFTGGLIGGYKGLENYMEPDIIPKDLVNHPKLVFQFEKDDDKKKKV